MRTLSWDVEAEHAGGSSLPRTPAVVGADGNDFLVVSTIASRIRSAKLVEGGATLSRGACAGVIGATPVVIQGGGALTAVV